jgi:UDP-N-acetyl-alpha-D-quinovosamine dehydrogenase
LNWVLVTGANGFLGRPLGAHLAERGHSVVRAVRSPSGKLPAADGVVATGDLEDARDLGDALTGVDVVVHLAARAHVMRDTASDPEAAFRRANLDATRHLAQEAVRAGVRRFVFLSSVKVNGEQTTDRPFSENDLPQPEDAYGRSKRAAEQELWRIAAATGLEVVVIRPPLVYGPRVKGNFLRLLKLADTGVPLPLARVRNWRSLVNVWNLCDLIALCVSHPAAAGETFLACDQHDLSTPELIRALRESLGKPPRLFPVPPSLILGASRLAGRKALAARLLGSLQVDSAKAGRLLGWRPTVSVGEGVRRTAAWYRETERCRLQPLDFR